ncbi:MAG: HU family DNA-binding protein [Eubacteriaceae bacterium]|nr:HU family DNA-binding protein [Eubacteriaceae bacterium]
MNKQDLVRKIAKESDVTIKQAALALDKTLDAITDALAEGEKVQLVGFGTFEARQRSGRIGRNPRTNEPVDIKPSKVPSFKAGAKLKAKVK